MKITPCDNMADEVPIKNNNKKTSLIKKKRMCKRWISCFLSNTSTRAVPLTALYLCSWATTKSQFFFAWKSYPGLT